MKMKFKDKGQTIIEAIIALAAIILILTSISIVVINSVNNSQFIKNQNIGNKYAQQAFELVRGIQKNDLTQFASYTGGPYCINESDNPPLPTQLNCDPTTANIDSTFIRTIYFDQGASPCDITQTRLRVSVAWSSGKCPFNNRFCHKAELVSCLRYQSIISSP